MTRPARAWVPSRSAAVHRASGFTLIELMVVIAIIVLAAGLMTPTITDFFKNRQLEGIRGHFGSAFNSARLHAVNTGSPVSLVFFREGVRVFDEKAKTFLKDYFNPETAPAADDKVWFELGFLDKRPSTALKRYRTWEKAQKEASGQAAEGKDSLETYNVSGLPRISFQRDGFLVYKTGSDVNAAEFKRDFPETSDLMIFQAGNNTVCFVDFRVQGQIKSKTVAMKEIPRKPESSAGDGEDVGYSATVTGEAETGGEP